MLIYDLNKRLKLLSLIFFLSVMIKYNFLMLQIFFVPSITIFLIRNLFFVFFYLKFIEPLLVSKKIRKRLFVMLFVFSFFFLANYWYNHYFGNFLSASDIFAGEGTGDFSMYEVLFTHIFRFRDILIILDMALLGILGFNSLADLKLFETWDKWNSSKALYSFKKRGIIFLLLFFLVLQVFAGAVIIGDYSPFRLYQAGSSYLTSVYGILPLYTVEIYSILTREEERPQPDPAQKSAPYYMTQTQLSGKYQLPEDTNIIMIQVESLDAKMVDFSHQDREITPFLNSLKTESLYFNNFYAQKVNGSFDADLSTLTSLYPVNRSYVFRDIDLGRFQSLPLLLKEKGYQTLAFHNNDRNFFNRADAYPDLGFDNFYSKRNFIETIYPVPEERGLGVNDYDFFDSSVDIIKEAAENEQPYFAFLISLTSHTPFNFYPEEAVDDFEGVNNNFLHNFYKSMNFLDRSLENFVNRLEAENLLDDALLVIYSDHESEVKTTAYESDRDFTLWRNVKKPHYVPLYFRHPQLESGIIEREGSTTDIAPTVLDLLAFEDLPEQFVGSSLLLDNNMPTLFIHETPHVLYNGQLYIKELENLNKVGHLKDQNVEQEISAVKIQEISDIINYMRNLFLLTQGEIFEEVE